MTPILVTGNKQQYDQSGFTLIELLVVLVIISITLGMVSLSLPNNDHRRWKDTTHRLTLSLNQAKDETTLYATPIGFQIDEKGWRFLAQNLQDETYILGDALGPYLWHKKTTIDGITQFQLDEPNTSQDLRFKIIQGSLTVTIARRSDGYFESR